jgi:hypothetical protein
LGLQGASRPPVVHQQTGQFAPIEAPPHPRKLVQLDKVPEIEVSVPVAVIMERVVDDKVKRPESRAWKHGMPLAHGQDAAAFRKLSGMMVTAQVCGSRKTRDAGFVS